MPMGWECVAVAEIEKFPCAVLKHHYPDVPNLGDVTKITQKQIEALGHIDVVIFGFPCQDLSVAGLRKGLKNADGSSTRSGLFFVAEKISRWAKARWTIGENVPGLFSSNEGRDFAAVVGELAGAEYHVPGNGWRSSGVALGPRGLIEWFVMDAQYCGLAQRRKRVFIIRDSGNWIDRPPLFLNSKSLQWHSAPRRETGKGTTADAEGGIGASGHALAPTLGASGRGFSRTGDTRGQDAVIPIQEIGKRQSGGTREGVGHGKPGDPMFTLQAGAQHGVVAPTIPEVAWALQERDAKGSDSDTKDGHLIPVTAGTLKAEGFDGMPDGTGRGMEILPVAFSSKDSGADATNDLAPTLRSGNEVDGNANGGIAPAIAFHQNQRGEVSTNETAGSLKVGGGKPGQGYPAVAFQQNQLGEVRTGSVSGTLNQNSNASGRNTPMANIGMQVRRLLPSECEILQGFPKGYTLIDEKTADGPRYRALGNSFPVPVISWIGKRIELVDSIK